MKTCVASNPAARRGRRESCWPDRRRASASSHMDAPLITLDDAANTTDVYAFVRETERHEVAGDGARRLPVRGAGHRTRTSTTSTTTSCTRSTSRPATTSPPAGRRISYEFRFDTRFKNAKTILQSYLGVIQDVDDAAQNLTQFYTVTKVDHRTGRRTTLGRGVVPPNNQGNATPFYNQGDNGENPAKDGVATLRRARSLHAAVDRDLDRGYVAFAGQRDDGFYGDIQAIFDLLHAADPRQGFAGADSTCTSWRSRFPIDELGGDRQIAGVYATTSRQRFTILADGLPSSQHFGDWVQVARQGNPLFNEGLVAIEDKDLYSRTTPASDKVLFRKYAEKPELAKLLNLLVFEPDVPGIQTGRTDIAGIFIPDVIKVDLSTGSGAAGRRRPDPSDQSG